MRPGEKGLSGSWFEFYDNLDAERLRSIIEEWKAQEITVRPAGCAALAPVDQVKSAGENHRRRLRVRHEPFTGSPSYAQIRGIKADDVLLLEELAVQAVRRLLNCGASSG
jgi:hypothetical protein